MKFTPTDEWIKSRDTFPQWNIRLWRKGVHSATCHKQGTSEGEMEERYTEHCWLHRALKPCMCKPHIHVMNIERICRNDKYKFRMVGTQGFIPLFLIPLCGWNISLKNKRRMIPRFGSWAKERNLTPSAPLGSRQGQGRGLSFSWACREGQDKQAGPMQRGWRD